MASSVRSVLLQNKACVTIPATVAKQSATVCRKYSRRYAASAVTVIPTFRIQVLFLHGLGDTG